MRTRSTIFSSKPSRSVVTSRSRISVRTSRPASAALADPSAGGSELRLLELAVDGQHVGREVVPPVRPDTHAAFVGNGRALRYAARLVDQYPRDAVGHASVKQVLGELVQVVAAAVDVVGEGAERLGCFGAELQGFGEGAHRQIGNAFLKHVRQTSVAEALGVGGLGFFVETRQELLLARPHGLEAAHDGVDHAPIGGEGVVVAAGGGGVVGCHRLSSGLSIKNATK